MTLKEQMSFDIGTVFLDTDEFAVTALYRHGAESKDISILMDFDQDPEGFTLPGQTMAIITAEAALLPDLAAGDSFEVDGRVWTVSAFEFHDHLVEIVAGNRSA